MLIPGQSGCQEAWVREWGVLLNDLRPEVVDVGAFTPSVPGCHVGAHAPTRAKDQDPPNHLLCSCPRSIPHPPIHRYIVYQLPDLSLRGAAYDFTTPSGGIVRLFGG